MRTIFKRLLQLSSSCIPHGFLGRFIDFPFLAPFYHIVSDEPVPHVQNLYRHRNCLDFKKDLDFFLKQSSPLSLSELCSHLKENRPLPRKSFFLSFDDGLRETYDIIAPILRAKGLPATFFLNSATVDNGDLLYRHKASILVNHICKSQQGAGPKAVSVLAKHGIEASGLSRRLLSVRYEHRSVLDELAKSMDFSFADYLVRHRPYLTTGQVNRLISDGFSIGAHSVDHPPYPEISDEEQLRQTRASVESVTRAFALDYRAFAFPFGDKGISNRFFSSVAEGNQVEVMFGSSAFLVDEHYPFVIQRIGMEDQPSSAEDILRMAEVKFCVRLMVGRAATRRTE